MIGWTQNELAMVESALLAGITPVHCTDWFPGRSYSAVRACFERVRRNRGMPPRERGRPRAIGVSELEGTYSFHAMAADARQGSHALLHRQLQTGQYFPTARAAYIARHGSMAA